MYQQLQTFIYLLLLYGVSLTKALTIRQEANDAPTTAVPQTTPLFPSIHRVRNAFAYEDADDVIHVIEPPKHFEQLKILMQKRQKIQPIVIGRDNGPIPLQKPIKRDPPLPAKTRPGRPLVKGMPKKVVKNLRPTKKPLDVDLEIQETENLPIEILASVRKTENYLKKYKPKIPSAPRQRVKTKKIQTVIWEKSQEQQQYVQGKEQKVNGIREYYQPQEKNTNRRKFIKKRIKRQTELADYETLKGDQLLEHINELVKNASIYLENFKVYEDIDVGTSTSTTEDTGTTTLLQKEIQCMQSIIKAVNTTTFEKHIRTPPSSTPRPQGLTTTAAKRYGERLRERKSKDLRHKPFLVATVEDEYFTDSSPSPLNTSLIYDDVMTTIRNLLQATNLQNLEESTLPSSSSSSSNSETEITPEILVNWEEFSIPQDNSEQPVDFHNLNQYLNSLQTIVANFPAGGIYNLPQPFHPKDRLPLAPPSTIFRKFPDIPSISEYLGASGSLLKATQNVIEIL
ncbi:uncharacterized protein LOC133325722 [Musca vetustissima]|uniref:uncharacterized protein LOC133325722 n=1 Tax=Musca vetustissima TaxID=27455 RepID=UPI002AB6EFA0|nr:uncharacterized protein LOC133325722 [Musca vetustissima]